MFGQKSKIYNRQKVIYTSPVYNDSKHFSTRKILIPVFSDSINDLITYFSNETDNSNHFIFRDSGKNEILQKDSLLPKFKSYIDEVALWKKNEEVRESDKEPGTNAGIHKKIIDFRKKKFDQRDKNDLKSIVNSIIALPNTQEKISLFLFCADISIQNARYYPQADSFCSIAYTYAEKIPNLYYKAKALVDIGDFARDYDLTISSLRSYYLAREYFENCNKDSITKFNDEADVCEKLGGLFAQINLQEAQQKSLDYFTVANSLYQRAANVLHANSTALSMIVTKTYLWVDFPEYFNDYAPEEQANEKLEPLRILKRWYTLKHNSTRLDHETNYLGFYSLATILRGERKYSAALNCYLFALAQAIYSYHIEEMQGCINSISMMYSLLGRETLASGYADLGFYLSEKVNNMFNYYNTALRLINNFSILKMFDSALFYMNKIKFDTGLQHMFNPASYNQLYESASQAKYDIFYAINPNSDSTLFYDNETLFNRMNHIKDYTDVVEAESSSVTGWLARFLSKKITLKDELIATKQKNIAFLKRENYLTNKIFKLNLKLSRDSTDKAIAIISRKELEIKTEHDKRTYESARNATLIDLDKEKLKLKQTEAWAAWLTVTFMLLIFLSFILIKNRINRVKTIKNKAEFTRVNDLAKNKIHNIGNDYSEIGNLLVSKDYIRLEEYNSNYESFLAKFLGNWKKEKITLEDELEALKRYVAAKKVLKNNLFFYLNNEIEKTKNVWFVQSVFDTLLDNTLKHGFKTKKGDCNFTVSIRKENKLIYCTISDNGDVSPIDFYLNSEDSGLTILKKRINNFYLQFSKSPKSNYLNVRAVEGVGTIIDIIIPYEEV